MHVLPGYEAANHANLLEQGRVSGGGGQSVGAAETIPGEDGLLQVQALAEIAQIIGKIHKAAVRAGTGNTEPGSHHNQHSQAL